MYRTINKITKTTKHQSLENYNINDDTTYFTARTWNEGQSCKKNKTNYVRVNRFRLTAKNLISRKWKHKRR